MPTTQRPEARQPDKRCERKEERPRALAFRRNVWRCRATVAAEHVPISPMATTFADRFREQARRHGVAVAGGRGTSARIPRMPRHVDASPRQLECFNVLFLLPSHERPLRILEFVKASDEPAHDQHLYLKAQIFYRLLGATDRHPKNFSVHLLPGGRFRLAPLFDVMSTQPNVDAGQVRRNQFKLAMAVGKQSPLRRR